MRFHSFTRGAAQATDSADFLRAIFERIQCKRAASGGAETEDEVILTIRIRLTLWYMAIFGAILVVFAALTYVSISHRLSIRQDEQLSELSHAFAYALTHEESEHRELKSAEQIAVETIREFHFRDRLVAVYGDAGMLIARSFASGPDPFAPPSVVVKDNIVGRIVTEARVGRVGFATLDQAGTQMRLRSESAVVAGTQYVVVVAGCNADQIDWLAQVRLIYAISIPLALLLSGGGGYLMARQNLAPVMRMCAEAERIGAANPDDRLSVAIPGDELGLLAGAFNGLLERLALAIGMMRRFTSDASHELRTPLAIIRGEAEVSLRSERTLAEYREALAIILDESRRVAQIVADLFTLTRADAGQLSPVLRRFDLGECIADCIRNLRTVAADKGIALGVNIGEEIPFDGDESLIRHLLLNLLDNAIKYTPQGGVVSVTVARMQAHCRIQVSDTGTGVVEADRERIFERFHRIDRRQSLEGSPTSGGAGLGLSIAREIARVHGGELFLERSGRTGSVFTVRLPNPQDN